MRCGCKSPLIRAGVLERARIRRNCSEEVRGHGRSDTCSDMAKEFNQDLTGRRSRGVDVIDVAEFLVAHMVVDIEQRSAWRDRVQYDAEAVFDRCVEGHENIEFFGGL